VCFYGVTTGKCAKQPDKRFNSVLPAPGEPGSDNLLMYPVHDAVSLRKSMCQAERRDEAEIDFFEAAESSIMDLLGQSG
jgi:hypothetical protein